MRLADRLLAEAGAASAKGDCFAVAFDWLQMHGNESSRLVHAEVIGRGRLEGIHFAHAYVVHDGMAIDKSNGLDIEMPAAAYERIGGIDKTGNKIEYSYREAVFKAFEHEHYGPWDLETSTGY